MAILAFFAGPIGRWIVVAALIVSTAVAAGWHERNVGWNERDVQAKAEVTQLNQGWIKAEASAISAAKAQGQADADKRAHDLKIVIDQQKKDADNAKTQHDKDLADARSGALRLRFATSTSPGCGDVPGGNGQGVSGPNPNTSPTASELTPEATGALYSIADDGDSAITEDNACWSIIAKTFPQPERK